MAMAGLPTSSSRPPLRGDRFIVSAGGPIRMIRDGAVREWRQSSSFVDVRGVTMNLRSRLLQLSNEFSVNYLLTAGPRG